ncbi:MAG: hypothetical protein L0H53_12980 [Candidatus Nitrosocosmicus sp.]|nr:hypothetical protein [Candidatus Nitrosocosmicus sp.]MDN5868887.1 hypothetical protein [Candidatus Nitrosocosmicus sp.]
MRLALFVWNYDPASINYAKLLTGINKIIAIVGGFHLTGGRIYEDAIEPTLKELKKNKPRLFSLLSLNRMESYKPNKARTT